MPHAMPVSWWSAAADSAASWGTLPELSISGVLREGHAASKELLAAASDAEVLVIGTHHREGGPGNTVTAVLNKARCNVLITR